MREILLTRSQVAFVDDEDYEFINQHKWHALKCGNTYYAARHKPKEHGVLLLMHREIMKAQPEQEVDHKNRNGSDNQKDNLRFATNSENQYNKCGWGASEYKGVSWRKDIKKWASYIRLNSNRLHLGFYNDEVEAAKAYDKAAKNYFGEFANTNFKEKNEDNSL
jgi:hypothetical protein